MAPSWTHWAVRVVLGLRVRLEGVGAGDALHRRACSRQDRRRGQKRKPKDKADHVVPFSALRMAPQPAHLWRLPRLALGFPT
jgi:hypothetical protein